MKDTKDKHTKDAFKDYACCTICGQPISDISSSKICIHCRQAPKNLTLVEQTAHNLLKDKELLCKILLSMADQCGHSGVRWYLNLVVNAIKKMKKSEVF